MRQLISLVVFIFKFFLIGKVLIWIYHKFYSPEIHPISEIDWVLVLLILDTWIVSHSKIEISGILRRDED